MSTTAFYDDFSTGLSSDNFVVLTQKRFAALPSGSSPPATSTHRLHPC